MHRRRGTTTAAAAVVASAAAMPGRRRRHQASPSLLQVVAGTPPYCLFLFLLLLPLLLQLPFAAVVDATCVASNRTLDGVLAGAAGAGTTGIPRPGSCCMKDACGLECPVPVDDPLPGYGDAVIAGVVVSVAVGISTYFYVRGASLNFFVAGRSLGLFVVTAALGSQSLDINSLLGNVDLAYKYGFWDGAVIPIGLGSSLVLNGLFLAHHVRNDMALTLPDVFAKRYGRVVELLVSIATLSSFVMLLAGNLYGFGVVTSYLWQISHVSAVWTAAVIIWVYTECGGLFSVVYTDVFQAAVGWTGLLAMAYWFIANEENPAPAQSIGFPGYIYPDTFGQGGACDAYNGTRCENSDSCCYNTELWCPRYEDGLPCARYDRAAYPNGNDARVYPEQMTSAYALYPYPNAIFWNWATIFILGFGNLAALDFQARCMASRSDKIARIGCIIGGCLTIFIGIPFSYLGAITRVYYGPDSVHSQFEPDSCHELLGLPTCALWLPDKHAFIKLLTNQAPAFLGGWCLIGLISAAMSTADGAILAMGTVLSNNILRQLVSFWPSLVTPDNLLFMARISTVPVTIAGAAIAAYYETPHAAGGTGYLLIVAFDIVFATVVVPLFGCFYARKPSPRAALVSILAGASTRITLEFVLPKDGFLLLPYKSPAFLDVGPAASANFPGFIDTDQPYWDPVAEPCYQRQFEDYTGADSLASFLVSLVVFCSIQFIESRTRHPLFYFPGSVGYIKSTSEHMLKGIQAGDLGLYLEDDDDDDSSYGSGAGDLLGERHQLGDLEKAPTDSMLSPASTVPVSKSAFSGGKRDPVEMDTRFSKPESLSI